MWGISPKPKKGGVMFSLASTYVNKINFEKKFGIKNLTNAYVNINNFEILGKKYF